MFPKEAANANLLQSPASAWVNKAIFGLSFSSTEWLRYTSGCFTHHVPDVDGESN